MSESFRRPVPTATQRQMRQTAVSALIAACLMLFFGFGWNLTGISGNAAYDLSVAVFGWTLRIGGLAMLVSALLCGARLAWSLAADAVLSALIGVLLGLTGLVWLAAGDWQGLLAGVFGVLFVNAARQSWAGHRDIPAGRPDATPSGPAERVEAADRQNGS